MRFTNQKSLPRPKNHKPQTNRQHDAPILTMNRKLISDISASTIQVILNQVLGLVIFFLTSRYLSKELYGEMNWSLALVAFVTTILSLRLEQVMVQRVAAGHSASRMLTLFSGHILFTGLAFYLVLFLCSLVFPSFFGKHDLLLILAISHLLSFFSTPFKQLANGMESFRLLTIMSSVSNLIRALWLLIIVLYSSMTIEWVLIVYITSSLVELIICIYLAKYRLRISFSFQEKMEDYFKLIRSSLPLAGAVLLNASIARIDWILLGIFTTATDTAEYSFAYKVFELSPFPLLIIAPILLSRLSKFFSTRDETALLQNRHDLSLLIRIEMILATGIPLVLNLIWTPLIDGLTANKYGSVNALTFFTLSCCIPFLYINNILWSALFAQNKLKLILRVTLVTFIVIFIGDLCFIPFYAGQGAALVYLVATLTEYLNYMRSSRLAAVRELWLSPLTCGAAAILCGFISVYITDSLFLRLVLALPSFCFLLLATKQLQKSDMEYMLQFLRKKDKQQQPGAILK